jgi:tRNA (Thr-GGU) A37 N-methylase
MVAAELQDSLLVVMHDLHRLEGLLSHATDNLLERFGEANSVLTDDAVAGSPDLVAVRAALRSAVTELQFQDMASQLIWHTTKVLQGCAFRLASEAMGQDEGEEAAPFAEMAPDRPNPVTQSEMDAGSVDLF